MKLSLRIALLFVLPALLFAQTDVTIGNAASSGGSWSGGNPDVWTATTYNSKLNKTEIESRLNAGTSVTIATTDGNIYDSAGVAIRKTSGGDATLKFYAYGTSTNRSVIVFNGTDTIVSTSGKLHLIFNADADGNSDGYISASIYNNGNISSNCYFNSNNGDIIYGGGSDPVSTPANGGTYGLAGVYLNGVKNIAGTGLISVRGIGTGSWSGIQASYATTFETTTGNITMNGTGGQNAYSAGNGISLASDDSKIQTDDGTISLTGQGGSGATYGAGGIFVSGGSSIISLNGNITLNGTGGDAPYGYNNGIQISGYYSNDPLIQTANGMITLNGTAGNNGSSSDNFGLEMKDGARVDATGSGAIVINAYGRATNYNGKGFNLNNGQSTPGYIRTNLGDITIIAVGGPTTSAGSSGLSMSSYGAGANTFIASTSGTINIHATSNKGGDAISMNGDNASIEGGGDITIIADTLGKGTGGSGIGMFFGSDIKTMGPGNLTITAIGAAVGTSNYGITMNNGSTSIMTERGNLSINAFGAGNSGGSNHGINMGSSALIYSSGIGDVRIKSTAGYLGYGMYLNSSTTVQADSGTLEITAVGNGSTYAQGIYRAGGGGGIFGNYGDSLIISATGTGTQNGLDGYGGSYIGGPNFAGELVIKVTAANSDHLNLSGFTISGTGHLTLAPLNASTTIGVAGGAGAFDLSTSDLGAIQNGFHKITIGRSDGTGTMTVNGYTFSDSTQLLSGSGTVNINGNLSTGSNSLDIATNGTVMQNSGVSVNAGWMSIVGAGSSYTMHMTVSNLITGVSTLTLNGSTLVNDSLYLGSANIVTGANTLTLGTGTTNLGKLFNAGGSIDGAFKRWFDAATVSDVQFPFASGANARIASLSFSSAPSSGGTITGSFSSSDPGSNGFPVTDGSATLGYSNSLGYWTLTADDGLSGGTYDVKFDVSGTTFNNLSKLHVVKRANSSSAWTAEGSHTLATAESGSITRAYRSGLTSFSEFAFGMEVGSATTLSIGNGNYQAGLTNSALTNPFAAQVTDVDGDPVPGENVSFAITATPYGATGQSLSAVSASTNGSGNALSTLTTGNKPGNYQVSASSGSLTGSPVTFTAHVFDQTAGSALTFDGVDDVVDAGNSVNIHQGTWEAWVKLSTTAHNARIIFKGTASITPSNGRIEMFFLDDGKFYTSVSVGGNVYAVNSGTLSISAGEWYHVAGTYDGDTLRLYVNGNEMGMATGLGGDIDDNPNPLGIGANAFGSPDAVFEGQIDEVRIWNIERSVSQIRDNIHNSFASLPSGLVAYWQFSDGTGSSYARDVINGVNAQLTNMNANSAWVTSAIPFGPGTTSTESAFTSGTAVAGTVSFTTTDAFDNAVDLSTRKYSGAPNAVPSGNVLSNSYWSIDPFGMPGTFSGNLTFTVPSSFTNYNGNFLSQYKLYQRTFGGDGSWTQVSSVANSATSTSVTFNGISQFGQFALAASSVVTDSTPHFGLKFDGNDDQVVTFLPTPTAYTIELWVKPNSTSDQGLFVRTDNGGEMSAFSSEINIHNGKFEHYLFDGNSWAVADTTPVVAGTWYHVVATATNNGQMRLFVNGAEGGTAVSIGTLWTGGDRYKIGVSHLGFFNGTLDEVRIWDSALDSTTIRKNMHRIFNSFTSGLIAQWQFVEGSGTTATDAIGGYTGTLTNFNFTNSSGWTSSTISAGKGTSGSAANFTTGTTSLSTVSLATSDDFDNAVQLTGTAINNSPNIQPVGSSELLSDRYWVIDQFGDGGTFSANLTFTVPSSYTTGQPASTFKLYKRESNADAAWSLAVNGASSVGSTTVTFNGITSFGQFAIGKDNSLAFDSIPGYALQFNGSNSSVDVGNPGTLQLNNGTVEAWIKIPLSGAGSGYRGIVVKKYQYGLFLKDNQLIAYDWQYGDWYGDNNAGDHYTNINLNDDQWHHIALVFTGGQWSAGSITIYIDGVNTNAYSYYDNQVYNAYYGGNAGNSLSIGYGVPNNSGGVMNGQIEEVKIWNTIRTAEQIRADMHRTQYGFPSGLAAYWQFNQGSGTTATEIMNGSNGTLINSPTWTASTAPLGKGTTTSVAAFTSGAANLAAITMTTTEAFDNAVDLTSTAITAAPNVLPTGYLEIIGSKYYVIHTFGSPGTFTTDLSINFGANVLDPRVNAFPAGVKLFTRNSNSDGAWTEIGGAASASSSTGIVTWNGITSFSQFAAVYEEAALPVELVSFTATSKLLNAELKWKTATEVNNLGFEVERKSVSGIKVQGSGGTTPNLKPETSNSDWIRIAFVEGNGSSNVQNEYSYNDRSLPAGTYAFRLKQIDRDGKFGYSKSVEVEVGAAPLHFELAQNFPNPFNPTTTISFTLQTSGMTTLKVYDILGKEVATLIDENLEAGVYHQKVFDGSKLSTGIYFARLTSGNKMQLKKMLMIK